MYVCMYAVKDKDTMMKNYGYVSVYIYVCIYAETTVVYMYTYICRYIPGLGFIYIHIYTDTYPV